jgi:threonine dehydrogenase-like Zn-dependent dehydrogenase
MDPMKQKRLIIPQPGQAIFEQRELPEPSASDVILRPALSSFKHGTEMMAYSGRSPFAHREFDLDLRLFRDRADPSDFYPRAMGSMVVGEIEWAGHDVSGLSKGQSVYAWAPIADQHVLDASKIEPLGDLCPEQALCIDPASFALGALIDGAIEAGDMIFITGLGAIGLFAVQYCVSRGATVIAASRFEKRRKLAAQSGASKVLDAGADSDLARTVKMKNGGADAAIECSGDLGSLHQAIRATKPCGRVVCIGFYGPGDESLNLGEEFFHNRITLLASLPALSWNNPTRGDPPLYAKDLQRRVVQDFRNKTISAAGMVDPILPFEDAERAVKLIAEAPENVIKATLSH